MDGSRNPRRTLIEALVLGAAFCALLQLPPLGVASRLDRWMLDGWTALGRAAPADGVVLVTLSGPAELDAVAALGHEHGAALFVTTLGQPPGAPVGEHALGPLALPVGESMLERTAWRLGGHLWLESDPVDGTVRAERSLLADAPPTPSLAYAAARALATMLVQPNGTEPTTASDGLNTSPAPTDSRGRRWLRYRPGAFEPVSLAELAANTAPLAGSVVIAGTAEPRLSTPLGPLAAHEIVAQAFLGYRDGDAIVVGLKPTTLAWLPAVAWLLLCVFVPHALARAGTLASGAVAINVGATGVAFALAGWWLPSAAPSMLLLGAGAYIALRLRPSVDEPLEESELIRARRLVAKGALTDAWALYREIPPNAALLPELYDLADAMHDARYETQAADLFHRIAQIDGRFRDVAKRLVRGGRPDAAPEASGGDTAMPSTLGRYELLEPIGRGAMGYVYLGRDPKINRLVAIKAVDLAVEFDTDQLESASRRFMREAETAGRLSHPNIVTIYDVGEADGLAYIAMEYLKGRHLSDFTAAERLLPVPTVLELLARTADALDYAHAQNVVHRDIKPANIMYDSMSESLKITDFGIARLIDVSRTRTGIVLGTPAFMSPEQLEGKNVNGHTDLFALGVSLYELLTGHLPFRGASMTKLMFVIANEPHPAVTTVRVDLPSWLDAIVDKALAKDPADRYATGADMAAALRAGAAQFA